MFTRGTIYPLFLAILIVACTGNEQKTNISKSEIPTQITEVQQKADETAELLIHESKYRILPVDESSQDKTLKGFVNRIKEIVQKKDLKAFISCLDTGVVVSWGGGMYGIPTFLEEWNLREHPEKSQLWPKMKFILELGGAWESKEEFRIPYTQCERFFSEVDFQDVDWYVTAVCVLPKTIVHKKPGGKKTGLLSFEIVRIKNRLDNFIEIQSLDKKINGFVAKDQIITSAEAFPVIEKVNGSWKITSFAPYD